MSDIPIIEAAKQLGTGEVIAHCPLCQGMGWDDPPGNMLGPGSHPSKSGATMPHCRLCKGRRYVYLNKICECGSCAVWYAAQEKVWYCGNSICLKAAVRRIHGPQQNVVSSEWFG